MITLFLNNTNNSNSSTNLTWLYVVVGLLIVILIGLIIWLTIVKCKKMKLNNHQNAQLDSNQSANEDQINDNPKLRQLIKENEIKQLKLDKLINEYRTKLNSLNTLDNEQIKDAYLKELSLQNKKKLIQKYNEDEKKIKEDCQLKANNIIISILERNAEEIIIDRSTTLMKVDDEMKSRVIGKEGRNKKTFEQLTGVDLIVEKDNPLVTLSSTNLARREIAYLTLSKIIESKNIEPNRIESIYLQIKNDFDNDVYNIGKNAIEEKLGIYDLDTDIYQYVGLLKFRSSYGQNILQHSLECANLASNIAMELGLDSTKARLAAFFHDIGKCQDLDMNLDHVQAGIVIAKKCNLPEYIIHAIETHHSTKPPYDVYGAITKIVDTLSSSRPGARIESYQEFIERVNQIEKICLEFPEVNSAYAIKSGRQVRVIIKPLAVKDDELSYLGTRIKEHIEDDPLLRKFKIDVTLIKENKYSFTTDISME